MAVRPKLGMGHRCMTVGERPRHRQTRRACSLVIPGTVSNREIAYIPDAGPQTGG